MALKLEGKKAVVSQVSAVANDSLLLVIADYRGLTVGEMNTLRNDARDSGVYLRVIRNTLAKRAVEGTDFECMRDSMVGPMVFAFAKDEPGAAARLFSNFLKKNDKLEVKAISIDGKALGPEHLTAISKLPTRDEAIATLTQVMQAPITKLVRTMAEPASQAVRVIAAIRDSKQ